MQAKRLFPNSHLIVGGELSVKVWILGKLTHDMARKGQNFAHIQTFCALNEHLKSKLNLNDSKLCF